MMCSSMCMYCMAHGVIQHVRVRSHLLLHASIVCLLLYHLCWGKGSVGQAMPQWHTALSGLYLGQSIVIPGVGLASMVSRPTAEQFEASTKEKLADPKTRPPTHDHCSMHGLVQVRVTCALGHGNPHRVQQTWKR